MLSALLLSRDTKELSPQQYAIAGVVLGFVYGLLSAGNGAAVALVPAVVGGLVGFIALKNHRHASEASLRRGWCRCRHGDHWGSVH